MVLGSGRPNALTQPCPSLTPTALWGSLGHSHRSQRGRRCAMVDAAPPPRPHFPDSGPTMIPLSLPLTTLRRYPKEPSRTRAVALPLDMCAHSATERWLVKLQQWACHLHATGRSKIHLFLQFYVFEGHGITERRRPSHSLAHPPEPGPRSFLRPSHTEWLQPQPWAVPHT